MTAWLEVSALLAALAAAAYLAADLGRSWRRRRQERRHLERLDAEPAAEAPSPMAAGEIERRLTAAGLPPAGGAYLGLSALLAALAFLGTLEAFPGNLAAAGLGALVAAWIPWSLLGTWARRRSRRFEEQLVDAVAFMTSALEAGENPTHALASAAAASEGAVAVELERVVRRLDAGSDVERALAPMVAGYDGEAVRLFAQTLIAKWDAGGDLAPVLGRIGRILRERLAMRLRLASELAGARISAVIVALMPYLLIPVLLWRRPEWIRALTQHPLGLQLLFVALLLQLVGILWLRRIMRTDPG